MTIYKYEYVDKLEVGSGMNPRPGYIHLDINPDATCVDIVSDARTIPLPDNSVGELLSVNMIEHIEWYLIKDVLREWARVVKHGGIIKIHTVDFASVVPLLTQDDPNWNKDIGPQPFGGNEDKWAYINHLVMSTNAPHNMHRSLFTKPHLERFLRDLGFKDFVYLNCNKNMIFIQGTKI